MVRDMRRYQKGYFATRSLDALHAAKNAEKEVDAEISKYIQKNGVLI